MTIAVIGIGAFGKNHVRALKEIGLKDYEIKTVDVNESLNPDVTDYKDVWLDGIDGVIIATPASSHYEIAKYFLEKGVSVLVEKPITLDYLQAKELVELAKKSGGVDSRGVVFQAGHIFRYNPLTERMIIELKRVLGGGKDGGQSILAIRSCRIGMHSPRTDCGVIWDYAIHDIDLINFIMCGCTGIDFQGNNYSDIEISSASLFENPPFEDIATLTYFIHYYGNEKKAVVDTDGWRVCKGACGIYTQIDVDWISPAKNRTLTFMCSGETLEADFIKEELRIYKSGMLPVSEEEGEARFNIRMGDIVIPKISHEEPLKKELLDFVSCIESKEVGKEVDRKVGGKLPVSNAESCLLAYEMLGGSLEGSYGNS